ncbi:hypothetical protein A3H85_01140 [Candidatus Daviesbacteria bacterium RIFCSPLOWO2_02_FULL_40_8]|uniref:Uncharacterized protein n=1 Tax=Candidatus Daviesbacteria bacterium RIFCSPLOWO2_01_FULL_40_24 TaxID=1797787 RepID=A0A1F5MK48_9BACT|nr:MAG: hypothetical protein A2780_02505 [Candidatus Daviesbacteria bacterium RIFCSPHIGHO2_01_FULL_41_45]OGE35049.1 MAG: hypothetical protein A3C32_01380 [Candidatus Daviesbacteria bacterium RIFCSPHIGHO2_02_FULL_41_14]OGE65756.1 MAG: hypothetical protein A3B49_02790 [Candidatus Daviesbacteria bacterium RIFCSPLOWO2_01_FULL_40_24]OGE67077.1 MAG: hypothetical protein A3H85_01140 [Candidatus Daviesbacteria bacterium RIFCSPLOWO2_02_FULL_40_8]
MEKDRPELLAAYQALERARKATKIEEDRVEAKLIREEQDHPLIRTIRQLWRYFSPLEDGLDNNLYRHEVAVSASFHNTLITTPGEFQLDTIVPLDEALTTQPGIRDRLRDFHARGTHFNLVYLVPVADTRFRVYRSARVISAALGLNEDPTIKITDSEQPPLITFPTPPTINIHVDSPAIGNSPEAKAIIPWTPILSGTPRLLEVPTQARVSLAGLTRVPMPTRELTVPLSDVIRMVDPRDILTSDLV